jgi:hypothetical protein
MSGVGAMCDLVANAAKPNRKGTMHDIERLERLVS